MPWVRRRGMRVYNFSGTPWDTTMTALNPDVWYTFEEAATSFANTGTDSAILDFDTSIDNQTSFQYDSISTTDAPGTDSGVGLTHDGGGFGITRISTGTGENLAALNSGAPSASGSIVILGRWPFQQFVDHIARYFWWSGITTSGMGLQWIKNTTTQLVDLRLRVYTSGIPDIYDHTWSSAGISAAGADNYDGQWHLIVITMNAGTIKLYWDGTEVTTGYTGAATGSGEAADWVDDLSNSGSMYLGGSAWNTNADHACVIDEFAYFDGTVLSATDVADLWQGCDDGALTSNERNGIVGEFIKITGAGPDCLVAPLSTLYDWDEDWGWERGSYGVTPGATGEGTPLFERSANLTNSTDVFHPVLEAVATTYLNGEGLACSQIYTAPWRTDTAGTLIVHFASTQPEPTPNNWNMVIAQWAADADDAIDPGTIFLRYLTNGTLQFYIQDSAGTAMDYRWDYTTEGTDDILDGNWHQIIIQQPADGNGIRLWCDGRLLDYNHPNVSQGAAGTEDYWFNNAQPAWVSSNGRMVIGCFDGITGTGQLCYEGYHGILILDGYSTVFTGAQGAALANAGGVP